MPDAEFNTEDVFENVLDTELTSIKQVDLNNLVSNTHLKMATDPSKGSEFILHPGDKVGKDLINMIREDEYMGGDELILELVRRKSFVHKNEYVPDQETHRGSVEAYNQPVFRNQGSPEGENPPDPEPAKTPAKPAEDKSTTPDPVAEEDVAANAKALAAGSGKDTPPKK